MLCFYNRSLALVGFSWPLNLFYIQFVMHIISIFLMLTSFFQFHQSFQIVGLRSYHRSSLFMGRAAVVRAATKGISWSKLFEDVSNVRTFPLARTDGAKSKKYNLFAKRIIVAVKAGGADTDLNRNLGSLLARRLPMPIRLPPPLTH